jgi:hypothetical protein
MVRSLNVLDPYIVTDVEVMTTLWYVLLAPEKAVPVVVIVDVPALMYKLVPVMFQFPDKLIAEEPRLMV